MRSFIQVCCITLFAGCLSGCTQLPHTDPPPRPADPYPSTYQPLPRRPTVIENAITLTGTGERIEQAAIVIAEGKIQSIGPAEPPDGAVRVDATGKWVTPGIIDVHSHLGVYPSPSVAAHADGNEISNPITAEVWAEHSVWPQDPGFAAALAGGVTTLQILPGSANLIGGRGVTLKNLYGRTVQDMKFPGAPHGLKMACGENPKRVYGDKKQTAPTTRMGNVAGYRQAWVKAQKYVKDWQAFTDGKKAGSSRA